jgi:hypothetical protein
MNYPQYCQFVQANYRPQHPHLFRLSDEFLVPAVVAAVGRNQPAALRDIAREVHPGVFVFDLFRPHFCAQLLEEITHYEDWRMEEALAPLRPNSMNNYGTILDTFGFAPLLDELMRRYVGPFATLFYPDVGGDSLDSHHGFVVEYQPDKDVKLDFHVDACEVTLNACLGREFTGGALYFRGVRCAQCQETPWRPDEDFAIDHAVGRAVLHRGRHRHGAHPITAGERHNLILWCRSSRFTRDYNEAYCPAWCGWPGPKRTLWARARRLLGRLAHPVAGQASG